MCVCQLAIGHVFDDKDYVDGGNGASHEISQKQGSRQDSICASAGESTLSCNNLSGQTQTNAAVDNAEDHQENDSGISRPSQADGDLCKNTKLLYLYVHVWHITDPYVLPL